MTRRQVEPWMRALNEVMEDAIYDFAHEWYLDLEDHLS
jgi:hypothetical protein